ncbi:MAG TPA: hypothetical protein VH186_17055 [Chloroflexia bacterium]|nr:hypothetical protein [Chloroflexia bacterium]
MSKTVGALLLGGLLAVVILSLGLIMWMWVRSSNDANNNATPTKSSIVWQVERSQDVALVDARNASTISLYSTASAASYTLPAAADTSSAGFLAFAESGNYGVACA